LKNRSALSVPHKWADIVGPTQRHATLRIQQMACLPGFLQALADLGMYRRWLQGQNQIPSGGKRDVPRQATKNLGEL
jgi:hypothetical protein